MSPGLGPRDSNADLRDQNPASLPFGLGPNGHHDSVPGRVDPPGPARAPRGPIPAVWERWKPRRLRGTAWPGRNRTGVRAHHMTAAQRRASGRPSPARSTRSLAAVVLAAGRGKRLKSARPKVLHEVCGRAILWHVLRALRGARPDRIVIVVSDAGGAVEEAVRGWGITPEPVFVEQKERLGTGHAVLTAERAVSGVDDVVVMAGDDPLFLPDQVRSLVRAHRRTKAAGTHPHHGPRRSEGLRADRPGRRRRAPRDRRGARRHAEVRAIQEVATLVYAFRREDLFRALPLVGRENRQREYYLHHVFPILRDKGERLTLVPIDVGGVLPQVNSRAGIARAARVMRDRILEEHMTAGVTVVDPDTTYVDVDVRIGADTTLLPLTFLQGDTRVGDGCTLGPSTRIVDSRIGDDVEVTFSVVRGARLGRAARSAVCEPAAGDGHRRAGQGRHVRRRRRTHGWGRAARCRTWPTWATP